MPVNQVSPSDYFRDEYAEFVNRAGKKSIYKYRCNLCDVRVLYRKSMGKHLRRYHSEISGESHECSVCGNQHFS